jgi:hypothetical protein
MMMRQSNAELYDIQTKILEGLTTKESRIFLSTFQGREYSIFAKKRCKVMLPKRRFWKKEQKMTA